jgi:hypothetical protein
MTSESPPAGQDEFNVICPSCGEVQPSNNVRCARCGTSLETKERRKTRLAELEQSRREAERNDVANERIMGFGLNGTRARFGTAEFFSEMSNQLRRRYVIVLVIIAVAFVLTILYGH